MHIIHPKTKLYQAVSLNVNLLPIFNRFDLKPGFGDKTIEQACNEHDINLHFLLEIVNIYHDQAYFPKPENFLFSIHLIVDYLRKTHSYYYQYMLKELETHLDILLASNSSKEAEAELLSVFYQKYKRELHAHINDEEKNVFPYVMAVQDLAEGKIDKAAFLQKYPNRTFVDFDKEHANMDEKMNDLKNLTIKYLPTSYEQNYLNNFLFILFRFEKDLNDHERIEDLLLLPKVVEIEKLILK